MLGQGAWAWANWLPIPGVVLTLIIIVIVRRAVARRSATGRLAKVLLLAGITMGLKTPLGDGLELTGVHALQVLLTYVAGLMLTREAALATAEMNGPVCAGARRINAIYVSGLVVMLAAFVLAPTRDGFTQVEAATAHPAALVFTLAFYIPHGIFSALASIRLARTLRTPAPLTTRTRNTAVGWMLVATASLNYDVLVHYIAVGLVVFGHDQTSFVRQFSLIQAPSGAVGPLAAAIASIYWLALPARLRHWWLTPGWEWLTEAVPLIVLSPPPRRPDVRAFRREVEVVEAMDMVADYVSATEREQIAHLATTSLPLLPLRNLRQDWETMLVVALGRRRAMTPGQPQIRFTSRFVTPQGSYRLGLLLLYRRRADRSVARALNQV